MLIRFAVLLLAVTALAIVGCDFHVDPKEQLRIANQRYADSSFVEASIALRTLLEDEPNNVEARKLLGLVNLELKDGQAAYKELSRALQLGAARAEVIVPFTRAMLATGRFEQVIEDFEADKKKKVAFSAAISAEMAALYGSAYFGLSNTESAERMFDDALKIDPNQRDARLGKALLTLGRREFEKAGKEFDELVHDHPTYAEAWQILGDLRSYRLQQSAAIEAYSQAIANSFRNIDALTRRATLLIHAKEFKKASADILAVKKIRPKHPNVYVLEGLLAYYERRLDAAKTSFETALSTVPNLPTAQFFLGLVQHRLGQDQSALGYVESVWNRYRGALDIGKTLAYLYLKVKDINGAKKVVDFLIQRHTDDFGVLRLAALIAKSEGKDQESADFAKRAEVLAKAATEALAASAEKQELYSFELGMDEKPTKRNSESAGSGPQNQGDGDAKAYAEKIFSHQFADALKIAERLREKSPDKAQPRDMIGYAQLGLENIPAAAESFKQALAIEPGEPVASQSLAALAINDRKFGEARQLYDNVLKVHPGELATLVQYARMEMRTGDREAAAQHLRTAIEHNPNDLTAKVYLARYYLYVGQVGKARKVAEPLLRDHPDRPEALALRGELELAAGQPQQAIAHLQKAAKALPYDVRTLSALGMAYIGTNRLNDAQAQFEQAGRVAPDDVSSRLALVRLKALRGDGAGAREMLNEAKEKFPEDPEVIGAAGWLALRTGNPSEASNFLAEASRYALSSPLVRDRANALWQVGKWSEGLAELKSWIQQHPTDSGVLFDLASYQIVLHQTKEAHKTLEQIVKHNPKHAKALNNLAWLDRSDNPEKALSQAKMAYQIAPEDPDILDTYGLILIDHGEFEHALKLLNSSLAKAPNSPATRFHKALALIKLNQRDDAKRLLAEIAAENITFPELPDVKALLETL